MSCFAIKRHPNLGPKCAHLCAWRHRSIPRQDWPSSIAILGYMGTVTCTYKGCTFPFIPECGSDSGSGAMCSQWLKIKSLIKPLSKIQENVIVGKMSTLLLAELFRRFDRKQATARHFIVYTWSDTRAFETQWAGITWSLWRRNNRRCATYPMFRKAQSSKIFNFLLVSNISRY